MSRTKNRKKRSGTASCQSQCLNPHPDNPRAEQTTSSLAQSTPTPSSSNLAPPAHPPGPRYLFTPVIGNHPRSTAPLPTLSSLDTLTPSPVIDSNASLNENLFIGNFVPIGAPRNADEINMLNAFRARQQERVATIIDVPAGANANPIIVENFVEHGETVPVPPINVNPSIEGRTLTENFLENGDTMSAKQRALRRAEKMPHHGATELDDDDVANDVEIQQAILDNTPPIVDNPPTSTNNPLRDEIPSVNSLSPRNFSYLPAPASTQLNDLFNQAVSILTTSLALNGPTDIRTQDSIAGIAGNHFAANLEAAMSNLMLPRMQNESYEAYMTRLHAQHRFFNGLGNQPPALTTIDSRNTVHFTPSTTGGSIVNAAAGPSQLP
ncbi:hypothetical protein C8J56DRAFT_1047573 [Mycena floridula]|nr:hypothetical protein C8J56DRAFT_1047573 [Mycena floridula]